MIAPNTLDKISARLSANREIVAALKLSANQLTGKDRRELLALAFRIDLCGRARNAYIARDAVNLGTGECYDAVGNYWHCNSKLCPNCLSKFSRLNRRKLRKAIDAQKLTEKERWYFTTFTIPNPNLGLFETRKIVDYAWSLFRKRLLCVSLIRGGAKSEEFTLTRNGFHYHLHTLFVAEYLHFQEVRRVWTECVTAAFAKYEKPLRITTKDGLLWVVVKPVKDPNQLINEVCKYLTKSDSWWKMRAADLAEVGLTRRWWRMFECFGSMAPRETAEPEPISEADSSLDILDTKPFTDGVSPDIEQGWRDEFDRFGYRKYRERVLDQFQRTILIRRQQLTKAWPGVQLNDATEYGIN